MAEPRRDVVLCLNSGSSSLELAVFVVEDLPLRRVATAGVERIGRDDGLAWVRTLGDRTEQAGAYASHASALTMALSLLEKASALCRDPRRPPCRSRRTSPHRAHTD
jgi:acetate kinase